MANIVLIGFMGAGKTTYGKWLAKQKNMVFLDTDEMIVEKKGMSINDIFSKYGEAYFRDLETKVLREIIESGADNIVLSVGGGLPVREENRRLMKSIGNVIYLKASIDTLCERLARDTTRPLLKGGDLRDKITGLMEKRQAIYEEAATRIIETDNCSEADVRAMILSNEV